MTNSSNTLPNLPLTCLTTAEELTTHEAFQGQDTVIDFWTTKCTRCPDALDKLNAMARDAKYTHVQFVSICCDQLDGAREIMEATDEQRWNNMRHYFMSHETKQEAKKLLGFKSVPFYVIVNKNGIMTQKGSSKQVDFNMIPGVMEQENVVQSSNPIVKQKLKVVESKAPQQPAVVSPEQKVKVVENEAPQRPAVVSPEQKVKVMQNEAPQQPALVSPERVLTIDLDFDF